MTKNIAHYAWMQKNVALAYMKAVLSRKPILNAPQLQDPQTNIYVFHLVTKQLIGTFYHVVKPSIFVIISYKFKDMKKPSLAMR